MYLLGKEELTPLQHTRRARNQLLSPHRVMLPIVLPWHQTNCMPPLVFLRLAVPVLLYHCCLYSSIPITTAPATAAFNLNQIHDVTDSLYDTSKQCCVSTILIYQMCLKSKESSNPRWAANRWVVKISMKLCQRANKM